LILQAKLTASCFEAPVTGAIVPVIRRFKPELIFQSESSTEVDTAWKGIQGGKLNPHSFQQELTNYTASYGTVALGPEESAKLAKFSHEPEKQIYGIEMYHQLHCLDIIRKSFYRDKFFPNATDSMFRFHKSNVRGPRKL
jgi:hypothetical protein